jgi:hypothetical protein
VILNVLRASFDGVLTCSSLWGSSLTLLPAYPSRRKRAGHKIVSLEMSDGVFKSRPVARLKWSSSYFNTDTTLRTRCVG